ncbi:MAG: DUF881 domain-containing protein [Candidatus Gastranaerophilales bacterium]|nr:DUF881 domain-containing protein [Candidatus Gastranaerophilales bacterium]
MKLKLDENQKYSVFVIIISAIFACIITVQLVYYSGYKEPDSAMMKKIESLVGILKELNTSNEQLNQEVIRLEREIFELKHGINPALKSKHLEELYMDAGLTDITGKGLVIDVVEPMQKEKSEQNYTNVLQSDDLLKLVNALKIAGAQAISVNAERLIATSAITTVDNAIVINKRKINPPYQIKVIGDYDTINSALTMRGGLAEYLKLFAIELYVQKNDNLTVPRYKK